MTNNQKGELKGKIILQATITNSSPMLIANGRGDVIDFEVIKDSFGKPVIPAAGFAGMLRNSFDEIDPKKNLSIVSETKNFFWGCDAKNKESQSHINIDDLKIDATYKIVERDGVAIDHKTNLSIDGSKFDYELIEPGAKFKLNAEITLRSDFDTDTFLQFLFFIAQKGRNGEYQQGAFKSSGFGILNWSEIKIFKFDFKANEGVKWFEYLKSKGNTKSLTNIYNNNESGLELIKREILTIEGNFSLKNSMIIRSDGDQTNADIKAPDKTQLKNSAGIALLTGKSLKGAIRHRAHKILNTIGYSNSEEFVDHLFGYVNEKSKKMDPSRIKSFETEVKHADQMQIQPRIKIDRFTGATIEHALMQSQPLWHKNETISLKFEIENCMEEEAALMLLVMKDLFIEDLPIGGEKAIGRGVITGKELTVSGTISSKTVDLKFDKSGLIDKTKIKSVNDLVSKLTKTV
jgi:CRISPR/Cas system CSM-associated protein Csm3 (group 7 of RAMP superfamily)